MGADGDEHPARITWFIMCPAGLGGSGAREEESVESCRIERHSVAVVRLASWRSVDYLPLDVCCC